MPQAGYPTEDATTTLRALCVDLDGTLVKSDTLVDSLFVLARRHPARLPGVIGALFRGKAAVKAYVTSQVSLDPAYLPYNRKLIEYLMRERELGRPIYLATGANQNLANRIAEHLGIFTGVLGSDDAVNLTGVRKLDRLRARLGSSVGSGEFDYVGNDTPDLPLLAQAAEPMVAEPTLRLRLGMRLGGIRPKQQFTERRGLLQSIVKAARPHQWSKNLLIFIPLLLAHSLTVAKLLAALAAFVCFSLTASSAYIVNDVLDLEADRVHPTKRLRPFANGDLGALTGLLMVVGFLAVSFAGTRLLPAKFLVWLLIYLVSTFAYSMYLKRIALVDVLVLSGLYILRLAAGSAATETPISHWLAGFSLFLFLSLAIVKRFAELENLRLSNVAPKNGRGYLMSDQEMLRSFGTASAYAAVVVLAIYISGVEVTRLYHRPDLLWFAVPLILLWLNRIWLLASRGELDEDPTAFAITDGFSWLMGACIALIAVLALL